MRTVKTKLAIVLSLSSLFGYSNKPIKESDLTAYQLDPNLNRKAVELFTDNDVIRLKLLLKADLWLLEHPMVLLPEEKENLASRITLLQAMLRCIDLPK